MRLLTNLCATLTFTPWPSSTTPPFPTTCSSLSALHPITHQSLLLHLHSYPASTPSAAALTKADFLISTLYPSLHPTPNPLITSEYGLPDLPIAGGITRPLTIQPDLAIFQSDHPLPLTSFVATNSTPFPDNTCIRSPSALAACYNDIFSDERFADPARMDVYDIRRVLAAVGRAVAAALCTRAGCAAITDGHVAVLLRVRPGDDGRVCVEVSRGFDCDAGMALVGLVGWAEKCGLEQNGVRECVMRVGNAKTKFWFDSMGRTRVGKWMGGFVEGLLKGCVGVAGVGGCGVVLESRWKGRAVAIKYWNEECVDGLRELLDEIGVYRMLVERFPHVVGQVVPKMIYYGVETGEGVLVTEFVGRGLRREAGRLMIGDERKGWEEMNQEDEAAVVQAAKTSLFTLHECGVAHGDVRLDNLRVGRLQGHVGGTNGGWMAWWIDLAHAEDVFEDRYSAHIDVVQFEHHIVYSSQP